MSSLSLLMMRLLRLSSSRGAVQRPLNPGSARLYTPLHRFQGIAEVAEASGACRALSLLRAKMPCSSTADEDFTWTKQLLEQDMRAVRQNLPLSTSRRSRHHMRTFCLQKVAGPQE